MWFVWYLMLIKVQFIYNENSKFILLDIEISEFQHLTFILSSVSPGLYYMFQFHR